MKTNLQYKSDKINLTPDFPCLLMGMEDSKRSEGVLSGLEANLMVFKSGEKNVYFISLDTLYLINTLHAFTLFSVTLISSNDFF